MTYCLVVFLKIVEGADLKANWMLSSWCWFCESYGYVQQRCNGPQDLLYYCKHLASQKWCSLGVISSARATEPNLGPRCGKCQRFTTIMRDVFMFFHALVTAACFAGFRALAQNMWRDRHDLWLRDTPYRCTSWWACMKDRNSWVVIIDHHSLDSGGRRLDLVARY